MPIDPTASVSLDPAAQARYKRVGTAYALASFASWGAVPIYFNAVSHVNGYHVLAHRVVWSVFVLIPILRSQHTTSAVRESIGSALRSRRTLSTLCLTATLIATNWLVFIYAINSHQTFQASLGYFINPLINVLLGYVVLGERLRRMQVVAVTLATTGVVGYLVATGTLPTVALYLALSFGFYGLLRKTAKVDGIIGLTIETIILMPFAITFLTVESIRGSDYLFSGSLSQTLLLLASGAITALPLLWFAIGARRLRYTTVGFLQYIAPTGHFLCALSFGEQFTWQHALIFGFIWVALGLYTFDAVRQAHAARQAKRLS